MNLYPAIKATMGSWDYFIVKMKMKDIVKEVGFASEMYQNKTLDEAIQRTLNESRVKSEIVKYLAQRSDRFFASIVVAALGGNARFYPVHITDDERFQVFRDQGLDEAFGVLSFDGNQKYFALDGQHRLKAIQTLMSGPGPGIPDMPESFPEEQVSVIMLVKRDQTSESFLQSYRRVFSSLNRYAKPTDADTNIIMDEDDAIAIITRRLLTDHDFFSWTGKADESPRVKTQGKNLKSGDVYFTTLQTLYWMNFYLLKTPQREAAGWGKKDWLQLRPSEEELDAYYEELAGVWNALIEVLPLLKSDPTLMRNHLADQDSDEDEETQDSLVFWPIGQELLARVSRALLSRRLPNVENASDEELRGALEPLKDIDWRLHSPPWRGLLLVQSPDNLAWRMRSEDRKLALLAAEKILRWKLGLDSLLEEDIRALRTDWHALLIPRPTAEEESGMWESI